VSARLVAVHEHATLDRVLATVLGIGGLLVVVHILLGVVSFLFAHLLDSAAGVGANGATVDFFAPTPDLSAPPVP
jgi:hypothetical protein